jgi:2-methylcitrate dehydratase PrpD
MAGVSAAELARAGFTGAPAVTVESDDVAEIWSDLARRWRILELYFKPYAVCRWAQPAIAGALAARDGVVPDEVEEVEVRTFHEATRLAVAEPATTEEAQYSLPFPVAVAVVRGRVAAADVDGQTLVDPAVLALSRRVRLVEDEALSRRFPAERLAQVTLRLRNGTVRSSEVVSARGGPDDPLTDAELSAKFHELADGPLGVARAAELEQAIRDLPERGDASELLDLLLS